MNDLIARALSNLLLIYGRTRTILMLSFIPVVSSLILLPMVWILGLFGLAVMRGTTLTLSLILTAYFINKTVKVRALKLQRENVVFLNFEDPDILEVFETNPKEYIKSFMPKAGKYYFLIDEYHYAKNPGKTLKLLYDTFENVKFIVTGTRASIVTEWDEFKTLKPEDLTKNMRQPLLIDGRRIYDPQEFNQKLKFKAIGLGR